MQTKVILKIYENQYISLTVKHHAQLRREY